MTKYTVRLIGHGRSEATKDRYQIRIGNARRYVDKDTYESFKESHRSGSKLSTAKATHYKKQLWWKTEAGETKDAKILRKNLKNIITTRFDIADESLLKDVRGTLREMTPDEMKRFSREHKSEMKEFFEAYEELNQNPWADQDDMQQKGQQLIDKMKTFR